SDCTIIGDRGYVGKNVQLDLFETSKIELAIPYRTNQKDYNPVLETFARDRKRIETIFSQLCDLFMITINYYKKTDGLFTIIVSKISAFTCFQFLNYENKKPIGKVKYALI
ncbi:MAG: transposase, partial [Mangrovibacterium sp.]